MSVQRNLATNSAGRAATFIDTNLEKVATVIDKVRLNMLEQAKASDKPVPLINYFSEQLDAGSGRLRATQGEDVVEYAKQQIDRHPALLTVAVAAMGAAAAQIAVAAVRKERYTADPAAETAQ
jgi:hypothetical protein